MYVYRESINRLTNQKIWEVGYYHKGPNHTYGTDGTEKTHWYCESKYTSQDAAIAKTSYLNGGEPIYSWLEDTNLNKQQKTLQQQLEAVPDLEPSTTHIDQQPTQPININIDQIVDEPTE